MYTVYQKALLDYVSVDRSLDYEIIYSIIYDKSWVGEEIKTEFFKVPIDTDRSFAYTNMYYPNRLPMRQIFMIRGIAITCDSGYELQNAYLSLNIGSRNYLNIPVDKLVRTDTSKKLNTFFELEIPLIIEKGQNFGVTINIGNVLSRLLLVGVELSGYLARPIGDTK